MSKHNQLQQCHRLVHGPASSLNTVHTEQHTEGCDPKLSIHVSQLKHLEDCCRLGAWTCQTPHLILCILGSILRVLGILGSGVILLLLRVRSGCVVLLCRILLPLVPIGCLLLGAHSIVLLLRHLASLFGHFRIQLQVTL